MKFCFLLKRTNNGNFEKSWWLVLKWQGELGNQKEKKKGKKQHANILLIYIGKKGEKKH